MGVSVYAYVWVTVRVCTLDLFTSLPCASLCMCLCLGQRLHAGPVHISAMHVSLPCISLCLCVYCLWPTPDLCLVYGYISAACVSQCINHAFLTFCNISPLTCKLHLSLHIMFITELLPASVSEYLPPWSLKTSLTTSLLWPFYFGNHVMSRGA